MHSSNHLNIAFVTLFMMVWGLNDPTGRKIVIINLLILSETQLLVTFPKAIFLTAISNILFHLHRAVLWSLVLTYAHILHDFVSFLLSFVIAALSHQVV